MVLFDLRTCKGRLIMAQAGGERMKQMMMAAMMCMMLACLCACPDEGQGDADSENDAAGDEIKAGNEPNNTVFWHNVICEDEEYVYVSSYYDVQGKDINPSIVRIGKSDGRVTEMGARGNGLSVYDGYLYFLDERNKFLYRMDLGDPDANPECITTAFIPKYMILNGKIYPSGNPYSISSMNLDGSDIEEAKKGDFKNHYFVYGYDDTYIYVAYPYEYETDVVDGAEICMQYIYRMDYNHENKEKLFEVYNDVLNLLDMDNNVMVMLDGYAYYTARYDGRDEIVRNELAPNSEKEIIYKTFFEDERFEITAITRDGIYMKKYKLGDSHSYSYRSPNTKLSLDGATESQIATVKGNLPFFVGRFDQKLYYVEGNKIFPFD